jgi:signal transduction histidine kinase
MSPLIALVALVLGVLLLGVIVLLDRVRDVRHSLEIKTVALGFVTVIIFVLICIEMVSSGSQTTIVFGIVKFTLVLLMSGLFITELRREHGERSSVEDIADVLRGANKKLSELDKAKTEFMSLATHQIRSPLTAIKGYASLILEGEFGEIPEEPREPIQIIFKSSNNLVSIVNEFLDISRMELGAMHYDMNDIPLNIVLEELCTTISQLAGAKDLTFTCPIPKKKYIVKADAGKLRQAIHNILDNAVKYTPEGFIKVSTKQQDSSVVINITDTGIGLDESDIPLLFDKFSRAKDATSVDVTGTGLGLYIAKEIVSAHGGTLEVFSKGRGKGSTWTVTLPLSTANG